MTERVPYGLGTLNDGSFEATVAAISEANPDSRLVGSLGRAVLYHHYYGDPYREFDRRGERPLATSQKLARDLDFLNAPNIPDISTHYPVDTVWANNVDAAVVQTPDKQWRLQSLRHGFDEAIDAEVMAPFSGKTVYGVEASTVDPMTHIALFAVRGTLRRKDELALDLMSELLTTQDCPVLPADAYGPFWELADMQRKGLMGMLTHIHRRHVPKKIATLTGDLLFSLRNRKMH